MPENIKLMQSFLNYCADKGKVINQNIANVNTENYQRQNVDFNEYLKSEMTAKLNADGNGHMDAAETKVGIDDALFVEDKPVVMEEEMAELARNTINFKFMSKRIGGYYKNLQTVIKSGG